MTKILSIFILMLFPVLVLSQEVKPNAAILIEEIINDIGIEEAQKKFQEILADTSQFILLEDEFNTLGYSWIRQGMHNESIAVLKMNVKAFPGSWNVYDSLGEILAWAGSTDEAIENFKKSLELNPSNENAEKNLSQIYGTRSDHENETKSEFQFKGGTPTGITEPYFGEEPPGLTPKLFAPGLISTYGHFEFACTFSPDGKEFYFTRRNDRGANVIMVSKWEEEGWTAPDTAAFSYPGDHEPHITPDGKKLYFGTSRAKPGADQPSYGIWVMDREGDSWSTPEFATDGMYVSATLDGSLYLTDIEGLTEGGIIKLVLKNGVFEKPVRLGRGVNHPTNGIHPFIQPDEEFILFDCQREDGYGGEGDIYVSFRDDDGNWNDAKNLGADVNGIGVDFCASVSPDGKYIFYTKNRDIYWVSASILETLK
jgi:hypothetical protein